MARNRGRSRSDSAQVIEIQVGHYVQWLTGGQYFFDEPQEVAQVVESEMGTFVFVIGGTCGIPVEEVVLYE